LRIGSSAARLAGSTTSAGLLAGAVALAAGWLAAVID
jgi:hypothetical protein